MAYIFLISEAITQNFNTIAELVIPLGIPSRKVKAEIEIYPVSAETKIRKCSIMKGYFSYSNYFSTILSVFHIR